MVFIQIQGLLTEDKLNGALASMSGNEDVHLSFQDAEGDFNSFSVLHEVLDRVAKKRKLYLYYEGQLSTNVMLGLLLLKCEEKSLGWNVYGEIKPYDTQVSRVGDPSDSTKLLAWEWVSNSMKLTMLKWFEEGKLYDFGHREPLCLDRNAIKLILCRQKEKGRIKDWIA